MLKERFGAIVIGAGFSGIYNLFRLRRLGLKCKLIEAGSDLGGTWYWNRYPGSRVDSDIPFYELSLPELWEGWTWSERYPAWEELQSYFSFVNDKLNIQKDCRFDSRVAQAHWDELSHIWHVACDEPNGTYKAAAPYLIMCTGTTSQPKVPELKGLETFRGVYSHTARWPKEGIETRGKRVGVIGTGASGVQVIQEIGRHVGHLTVFQRTPNLAIPMRQCYADKRIQENFKQIYEELYRKRYTTPSGFAAGFIRRSMMADTEEQREKTLESLWEAGGLSFLHTNYQDYLVDENCNKIVYEFWRKNTSERLKDPRKRELLAPSVAPHPFACKRPSLEQHYFEVFNQDNVEIVNLNASPIIEITSKGVRTTDKEYELDVLVLATGFDVTGAFKGIDYADMAMTIDHFPNLFATYGPQGPTIFANGPTVIEVQGEWVAQTINLLRRRGITKFMPTSRAVLAYKHHINALYDRTLLPKVNGWCNDGAIPIKTSEAPVYVGGLANYRREITEEMELGYPSFEKETLTTAVTSRL